ncbi:MAG TPA: hypothetical protein VF384_03250 [Planctomycetota bacterium]
MTRLLPVLFAVLSATMLLLSAQMPPAPAGPAVSVPTFANSTCPIMGKKVSMPLFVDTELGRIYLCCKPCVRKVQADVPAAHKTAYPVVQDVANQVCPVSGNPIGEHRTSLVLQGFKLDLCCEGCIDAARKDAQVVLARVNAPGLTNVGNQTSPVDGKPVAPNAFAVVGDAIVRLSSPQQVTEVEKAPQAMLDKARAIRAKQPQPEPHRHAPKAAGKAER